MIFGVCAWCCDDDRAYKDKMAESEALRQKYEEKLKQMDDTYNDMLKMKDDMPDDLGQVQ